MKLRIQICRMSLVVWYLIAPSGKMILDAAGDGAIPDGWYRMGRFETEAECSKAQRTPAAKVEKGYEGQRRAHPNRKQLKLEIDDAADCVDGSWNPEIIKWPIWKPK